LEHPALPSIFSFSSSILTQDELQVRFSSLLSTPSDDSKTRFSHLLSNPSDEFLEYFIYMFILGPFIHTETGIIPFIPENTHFPLRFQLSIHQYRSWSRVRAPIAHSPAPTSNTQNESPQQQQQQRQQPQQQQQLPPDFTANPLALFQLTLLPLCPVNIDLFLRSSDMSIKRFTELFTRFPFGWKAQSPFSKLLLPMISHCFPYDPATRDALANDVMYLLMTHSDVYQSPSKIRLSLKLYEHGRTTLHQFAHRHITGLLQNPQSTSSRFVDDFLCSPFQSTAYSWEELSIHITLCVHAGFLTPFPLPPQPPQPSPPQQPQPRPYALYRDRYVQKSSPATTASDLGWSSYHLAHLLHSLMSMRSLLHATLIRLTGLISYFPQSTQLLASAIRAASLFIRLNSTEFEPLRRFEEDWRFASLATPAPAVGLNSKQLDLRHRCGQYWRDIPLIPPHSIPDPCDSTPNLQSALVDDNGKLHAVKYTGLKNDAAFRSDGPQSTAHLQSLFEGTAVSDLDACLWWNGSKGDPYLRLRPRISYENLSWIGSKENDNAMKLPETRALQKKLHTYYRQVAEVETNMVIAQMQKVLLKADQAGLFDVYHAAKRKQPPIPRASSSVVTHPHPTPSATSIIPSVATFYPFSFPNPTLEFFIQRIVPLRNGIPAIPTTPTQRGVLYRGLDSHANFLYDHNYSLTTISHNPDATQDGQSTQAQTQDLVDSLPEYARNRSEWALELLIVGCFGLHSPCPVLLAPSPPLLPSPPPPQSLPRASQQSSPPSPARIQYCKDRVLSNLPRLLDAQCLQPTPPLLKLSSSPTYSRFEFAPLNPPAAKLTYYYETISQLPLLSTLSLLDTLATLPCTPSPPSQSSGPTQ
jgi:hypothetical protein